MKGFLRDLVSGFPDGGSRRMHRRDSTDDARRHLEPHEKDASMENLEGIDFHEDGEEKMLRSDPSNRVEDASEMMASTESPDESGASLGGASDELHPIKRMVPGIRFRCRRFLNKGANGFVVLAEDKTEEDSTLPKDRVTPETHPNDSSAHKKRKFRALKFLELHWTPRGAKYIEREIINHFKLKHPHVIKLEEIFVTETHLALVLEYADGGDLFSYVKHRGHLSESHARWFFQQIILALDYCHQMGIVNRDIKLENILLSSNELPANGLPLVKLSDFGFSKDIVNHSPPATRLGTPMYIAPEVLKNKSGATYDGIKSDMWGVGVVLHVMLTGQYPFLAVQFDSSDVKSFEGQHEMMARIRDEDYRRIPWLSKECNELIEGLLDFNPKTRLTTSSVMQTAWFRKGMGSSIMDYNEGLVLTQMKNPRVTSHTVESVHKLLSQAQASAVVLQEAENMSE